MSIPEHTSANFRTMVRAAENGDLALVTCSDATTGEPRYVICAVSFDGNEYLFTPFGHLADGNPYEAYVIPGTSTSSDE